MAWILDRRAPFGSWFALLVGCGHPAAYQDAAIGAGGGAGETDGSGARAQGDAAAGRASGSGAGGSRGGSPLVGGSGGVGTDRPSMAGVGGFANEADDAGGGGEGGATGRDGDEEGGGPSEVGGAPSSEGGRAGDSTQSTGGASVDASAGTGAAAGGHAGRGGSAGEATAGAVNDPSAGRGGDSIGGAAGSASSGAAGMSSAGSAGTPSAGTGSGPSCTFAVTADTSPSIATVGIVDWTTTLPELTAARVVYALDDADASTQNRGGTAPVDVAEGEHHTLLLGLKQQRTYTFHVEAEASGVTCRSADQSLTTGALPDAPAVTRGAVRPAAQAQGFIVTSGGFDSTAPAMIIDADGSVVWTAAAPANCSRALLDFEAKSVWMVASNATNSGGDLSYVSLDGATRQTKLTGFSRAHHDLTALPGGRIAAFAWSTSGVDPESDLLVREPDGRVETVFHVGSNLYEGGPSSLSGSAHSYHSNSLHYYPADDSFTIGDRNASAFVKVSATGTPKWQFGGRCDSARALRCVSGSWDINHGHQLLPDGTFLFFNNTGLGHTTPSSTLEFLLTSGDPMSATARDAWSGPNQEHSDTLGDVQRLPNGNTLVTFSNNGIIYELDADRAVVQTLTAKSFGYSEWRPTLYGAPAR
jgi:hypothetical protein